MPGEENYKFASASERHQVALPVNHNFHFSRIESKIHAVESYPQDFLLGSDHAGKHAAVLLSITSTCKRHKINPAEYIKDVLETLIVYPGVQIDSLLPNKWRRREQKFDFNASHITPKLALR